MRVAALVLVGVFMASEVFAQWTVVDPSNLIQTTATAKQLLAMSARLQGLERYRLPSPLPPPVISPRGLEQIIRVAVSPYVARMMASHIREINIADEVIARTRHGIDNARWFEDPLSRSTRDLEGAVTTIAGGRSLTAVADSIAAGQLLGQRQAQVTGALLTSLVELQAVRAENERDAVIAELQTRAALAATPQAAEFKWPTLNRR